MDTTPAVVTVRIGDSTVYVEITDLHGFEGTLRNITHVKSVRHRADDDTRVIVTADDPDNEPAILATIKRVYAPRIREGATI